MLGKVGASRLRIIISEVISDERSNLLCAFKRSSDLCAWSNSITLRDHIFVASLILSIGSFRKNGFSTDASYHSVITMELDLCGLSEYISRFKK